MSRTPEQTAALQREQSWTTGEKCRRKGGNSMITYFVADTNEDGVMLKIFKGGRPIGTGKWHSWKNMEYEFLPSSSKRLSKLAWYGNKGQNHGK